MNAEKNLKGVYYIAQTVPFFKVCSMAFSKQEAEEIAEYIYQMTGARGRVVYFTKEELEDIQ